MTSSLHTCCIFFILLQHWLAPIVHRLECYAVIDDQSNRTLGESKLFDYFDSATRLEDYTISTCSGSYTTAGRCVPGLVVESHDGTSILRCPPILECDDIPDNKREVATPSVARAYPHLRKIANYIPELQETASVSCSSEEIYLWRTMC